MIVEVLRWVRCGIADESYGLDMSWVRSIQRTDRLRRSPKVEGPLGWLPGIEGEMPVFSLASQLRRPLTEGGPLQRIVVLNAEPRPWALLVDRVSPMIQVSADRLVPLPPVVVNPATNYFQGVIRLDEELILLLSPERLNADEEARPAGLREATSPSPPPVRGESKGGQRIKEPLTARAEGQRRSRGQILVFPIAEPYPGERALSFGLSVSQVPEILEPLPMIPVPAAPDFVLGLVNWRDRPVPVIDPVSRLGLAPQATTFANGRTRLLIARASDGEALVGFLIGSSIRTLRLPIAHQPSSRTLSLDQTLTRGIVELENETLVIPDIRGILYSYAASSRRWR